MKTESELAGKLPPDIKRGFVSKRVPHVALKAIANNEEIDAIRAEFAPKIEQALVALNKTAKKNWQEWEVPRELVGHAHPLPGPLPREEGESFSAPEKMSSAKHVGDQVSEDGTKAVPSPGAESFSVRHAYFTGADEPYEKLKRVLRADIDEAAWSSLYSTVSRPFDKPRPARSP